MTPTLYQTLLGAAFFRLPDGLRALHGVHGTARYAGEVTVVLPPEGSQLLTRELLYTGVTRAKESVRIVGTPDAVRAAVQRRVRRASGLRAY